MSSRAKTIMRRNIYKTGLRGSFVLQGVLDRQEPCSTSSSLLGASWQQLRLGGAYSKDVVLLTPAHMLLTLRIRIRSHTQSPARALRRHMPSLILSMWLRKVSELLEQRQGRQLDPAGRVRVLYMSKNVGDLMFRVFSQRNEIGRSTTCETFLQMSNLRSRVRRFVVRVRNKATSSRKFD